MVYGIKAVVYDGKAARCDDDGCAKDLQALLERTGLFESVDLIGDGTHFPITAKALAAVDLYVQPGGDGDLSAAYKVMNPHEKLIVDFVKQGGMYLGICMGAYLAGPTCGFNILPQNVLINDEISLPHSQYKNTYDELVNVDYRFQNGTVANKEKMFFQDGAAIIAPNGDPNISIIGSYVSSGRAFATLSTFGKGTVGLMGTHPEADHTWCK